MIQSIANWHTNAELIRDCATLGYLQRNWYTLDATYGHGTFWRVWWPDRLVRNDADPEKGDVHHDFTALPFDDCSFDAVVFDPPYKLNGTPDIAVDSRYGVGEAKRWQDRMTLIRSGLIECARVLGEGFLLVKCQDQVCSGKKRWQTYECMKTAETVGLGLVDRFDFVTGGRPQPTKRRQVHSHSNASQLLVFKRGW